MTDEIKAPTHNRLLAKMRAIGPYLRDPQSQEGNYYFDCLSVCVDDKQSPECREFFGWWMELTAVEGGFQALYRIGKYDIDGEWQALELPKNVLKEVTQTQQLFHDKLDQMLNTHFRLTVEVHDKSAVFD
ncbi:sigma factor-binding protein Crl [Vibrio sp. SM6]|uniref:Sigma factor-binding protein Crl n=1 Tax=Vibrio agarilyticus TaxID=2726741 RepID=A0A7X8YI18_9VIBR|nr:sigma factor-binding protein Crl [Vibrio agarilyticus]NLS14126.1 sigma factor-binding protein Crl [Vibrio agarilyticus]